jgi:hypothetical protein
MMRLALRFAAACLPFVAVPAFADCADEVRASLASLAQAGPQSIVSTIETKDGVIDVVSEKVPGAMHSRRTSGGVVSEYTLLGDRAWSMEADSWSELPAETAAGFAAALKADSSMSFEDIGDVECLGIDRHTFLQSYRLTYVDVDTRIRAALQADPETGLPSVLQTWSTGGEKFTTTSRFSYDAGIAVEAPLQFSPL